MSEIILKLLKVIIEIFLAGLSKGGCGKCSDC